MSPGAAGGPVGHRHVLALARRRLLAAAWALLAAAPAMAQYNTDAAAVMKGLRSDPRIAETLRLIREEYYGTPDLRSAANHCVQAVMMVAAGSQDRRADVCLAGMMGGLDGRSAFLNQEDFRRMSVQREPAGIGVELRKVERGAGVVRLVDGAPASLAGVQPGDVFIAVNGQSLAALSLPQVVETLRGPEGSVAVVDMARGKEPAASLRLEIRRERLRASASSAAMLPEGVAYVRLRTLSSSIGSELAKAARELLVLPVRPPQGLILDLRDCPGGLLKASVALAAAFLPDGEPVLAVDARNAANTRIYRAHPADVTLNKVSMGQFFDDPTVRATLQRVRLVILINSGTESGAVLAAAVLREANRAVLMGASTGGGSEVHAIFPLKGQTAIKLYTGVMRTPSGRSFVGTALQPDVVLEQRGHIGDELAAYGPGAPAEPPLKDAWLERAAAVLLENRD